MPPSHTDRHEQRQLHPPIPHLDRSLFECALAEQRRLRMEQFEVAADSDALRQMPTVVECEHRNPAERILLQEFRLAVDALEDIDFFEWNADPLLRAEDARAARVRGARG